MAYGQVSIENVYETRKEIKADHGMTATKCTKMDDRIISTCLLEQGPGNPIQAFILKARKQVPCFRGAKRRRMAEKLQSH